MSSLESLKSSLRALISNIEKIHIKHSQTPKQEEINTELQDQHDINEYEKMASDIRKIRKAINSIKS